MKSKLIAAGAVLVAVLLTGVLGAGAASASSAKPPFYPIDKKTIKVPNDVQPWLPTYSPDGKHIVFQNQLDGSTWATSKDGKGTSCITCEFSDRPDISGGFTYVFPDNKRLFVSHELGGLTGVDSGPNTDAWILECSPSIYDCQSHQYLPVDMSDDKVGVPLIVQRRTWHLAPDGVHLGWMDIRLDGTVMIVGRLTRLDDRYKVVDQKAVNPYRPTSLTDTDAANWAGDNQLWELKSFADGGASILALGGAGYNIDPVKINLKTGKVTRLTANPDWDEDGAISPDGKMLALYSWRTRHRLDAFGWIPQIDSFVEMPAGAALAPFYVSTWPGFQCDLSPWLLSSSGDMGGKLIGQPLNVYPENNLTPGNNLSGNQFWSPNSQDVLLQERTRTIPATTLSEHVQQKGLTPNRIAIAHIERPAGKKLKVVSSEVGNWAVAPTQYFPSVGSNTSVTVNGKAGGTADLVYTGNLQTGSWSSEYHDYSKDGRTFVNGTYFVSRTIEGVWTLKADVTVTGQHTGRLNMDMTIQGGDPLPIMTGGITAVYDGKKAPALPKLGACYKKLPQKSRLAAQVKSKRAGKATKVTVTVTANVYGDRRPVQNAKVKLAGRIVRTDRSGKAKLKVRGRGTRKVLVTAGDTFIKTSKVAHLKQR